MIDLREKLKEQTLRGFVGSSFPMTSVEIGSKIQDIGHDLGEEIELFFKASVRVFLTAKMGDEAKRLSRENAIRALSFELYGDLYHDLLTLRHYVSCRDTSDALVVIDKLIRSARQ